ncbi:MAG TPA: ATP-binding protein [Rhizomicrobium sp.]|jgi:two-component system phosphate regulon sensor histidine kinase PhoR|nr:ATP-binding protein [Rhizomicrobium sp.]
MASAIPGTKLATPLRERFALGEGLCWLAAGLAAGGALFLLNIPYASELLIVASVVSATGALALTRRSDEGLEVTPNNIDGGAAGLPPRAREMLERLPDPLMLLDESNRVVLANGAMRAFVGTDANNKHVSAVLRTPALLEAIERTAATAQPQSVEFSLRVPLEQHYQAHVTCTEHTPRLTAVLLHNVTAMVRAQEARSDFIANASHELRTPLAALSGFIDTLRGHARDDEEARERFLDIMSGEANRMRRLIDDLLSLTRIEQNEHVPPVDEVDIHGVVSEAAAALQGLASLDKVVLSIEEQEDLPRVLGDRDELVQLFQNLMHNAIKYGRPAGRVQVTFSPHPEESAVPGRHGAESFVAVAVKDDGEGIPREAIPRLTERFYRVDVRRSRERGGTGLGLAIVKHIVNRHLGRLSIDSQPGEGSTFTVLLPVAAQPEPRSSRK